MTDLTDSVVSPALQAAAMYGIASNKNYDLVDRLQAAIQALEWFEADRERLQAELANAYSELQKLRDIAEHPSGW